MVNYDVPHDPEDYIHRIGRTARASATGRAITFVSEKEQGKFHRIETFMERDVEKLPIPEHLGKGPVYNPDESDRRFSGRGGHGRGGNRRDGQSGAGGRGGRNGRNRSGRKNPEQGAQAQSSAQARRTRGQRLKEHSRRVRKSGPTDKKTAATTGAASGGRRARRVPRGRSQAIISTNPGKPVLATTRRRHRSPFRRTI